MRSIRDVMGNLALGKRVKETPKQSAIIADCLDVASAWDRGELPLTSAVTLTGDGYNRFRVSRQLIPGTAEADLWRRFTDEIHDMNLQNCEFGGLDLQGFYMRKLDVVANGGTVGLEADEVTGELICRARFPRVNLAAPPKVGRSGDISPSPYAAEWDQ